MREVSLALTIILKMHVSIIMYLLSLRGSLELLDIKSCLMYLIVIRLLRIQNLIGKLLPMRIIKSVGMLALLD
jgi:hypothetical protein